MYLYVYKVIYVLAILSKYNTPKDADKFNMSGSKPDFYIQVLRFQLHIDDFELT